MSLPRISEDLSGKRRQTLASSKKKGGLFRVADPASTDARVLEATSAEEPRTIAQIAKAAGLPISTARYALKKLICAKDVLRRKKGEYVRVRGVGKTAL
jgi:predicted ArsR family transcriptional regulator